MRIVGEIRELISLSVIFIFRGRPRAFTSTSNEGLEFHSEFR